MSIILTNILQMRLILKYNRFLAKATDVLVHQKICEALSNGIENTVGTMSRAISPKENTQI